MVDNIDRQEMAASTIPRFATCSTCRRTKPASDFYDTHRQCKSCVLVKAKARYAEKTADKPKVRRVRQPLTPERQAEKQAKAFLRRMNITVERRDAMLASQGGVCAICKGGEPNGPTWCTDHDHSCCPQSARSCGECIRGVLCFRCNTLLGHAKDSVAALQAAIEYLTAWEQSRG